MNDVITEPLVSGDGVPMLIPPDILASFEKAHRKLKERYNESPGVEALVRMWLSCGRSSLVCREFELTALNIKSKIDPYDEEGEHDGDEI